MKYILLFLLPVIINAATTGTVVLSGTVPKVVSITVTGTSPFNNLDLTTSQVNLPVANVTEQSNDTLGYSVTCSSLNAGALKNGTNSLTYTAKYNNVTFTLSTTPVNITTVASQTSVVNVTKALTISYTGVPSVNMVSGNYTDTLTFTIAAN